MSNLSEMELFNLSQLANSTKVGMVDRGNPVVYKRLEASGYAAEQNGGGFCITTDGLAYLSLNKHKIYGPKKRTKKPKKAERIERDSSDDFSYEDFSFND